MPILEVENLSISFYSEGNKTPAVEGVSFNLDEGATLGIVGESGSGKSVTALGIMGLLPKPQAMIDGGSLIYHSKDNKPIDLLSLKESEIQKLRGRELAMVFQEPMTSLNPVMCCGKQLREVIVLHTGLSKKAARQKALELFREVQLPRPEEVYSSYPHQLSGGQKQRVMIAMALSCNPKIIIADEPTTALDVTVQKNILQLLEKLQLERKMSIIFITHDLGVVTEIADEIIVMHQGIIVEQGKTRDVFKNPSHPYTQGLLACRPTLDGNPERLPTISDFLNEKKGEIISPVKQNIEIEKNNFIASEDPVLQLRHVKKQFKDRGRNTVTAVDNVSMEVYPGETIGLVGESGCGKTTLGRTILRLVDSDGGDIVFKGKDLSELSYSKMKRLRKSMQIIFQDPYSSLNPRINTGQAIMEPMAVHGILATRRERKQRALELLEKVGLEAYYFYRYPHEFSGGQRQRICIARALAVEPEFIICDESVSALDVSVQARILNLLNDLKQEFKFTYIFISHDLAVVKYMSDRIFVMKDGKIIESGDANEVYLNPKTAYTRQLIDAIPKGIE